MKKVYFVILTGILFTVLSVNSHASFKAVQVLVKGVITDEITGKPTEATLEFRTPDGKRYKIKSNSIDGKYEQIFNSGDEVEVILSNWDIARKITKLKVKDTSFYTEQKNDFTVLKFTRGETILKLDLFEPNSSALKPEYKNLVETLKDMMMFNRNVKIELRPNSHDSYSKIKEVKDPPKQAVKKAKKGKKPEPEPEVKPIINIIEPDMQAVKSLVDARLAAVAGITKELQRLAERIKTAPDYSVADPQDQSGLANNPDFEIVVTECKNPFE